MLCTVTPQVYYEPRKTLVKRLAIFKSVEKRFDFFLWFTEDDKDIFRILPCFVCAGEGLVPFGSSLNFTSMTDIIHSTVTNSRYVVFIRAALVLKPHNLLTAEVCMGQPEINLTHNWVINRPLCVCVCVCACVCFSEKDITEWDNDKEHCSLLPLTEGS